MKKYLAITVLTVALVFISAAFTSAAADDDISFRYGGTVNFVPMNNDDDTDFEASLPPVEASFPDSGPEVTLSPGYQEVYGMPGTFDDGDDGTSDTVIPADRFRRPDAYIDVSIPDSDTDGDIDTDTDGGLDTTDPEEPITDIRRPYGDIRIPVADIPRIPDRTPTPDPSADTDIDSDRSGSSDTTSVASSGTNCPDRPCCRTNCAASEYAQVPAVIETTANWMAYSGTGGCSLTPVTGTSNALLILMLGLAVVPMAIRRSRQDK